MAKNSVLYMAEMNSSHYDWFGVSHTKEGAIQNLIDFWNSDESSAMVTFKEYAEEYDSTVKEFIESDINVTKIKGGTAWQH